MLILFIIFFSSDVSFLVSDYGIWFHFHSIRLFHLVIFQVTKILSGHTTRFSCDSVPSYVNFFVQFTSSLTNAFEEGSNLGECVTSAVGNAESLLMDLSK